MTPPSLPSIRIHAAEYAEIPRSGLYMHFNLAPANHATGVVYALPRIVAAGVDGDAPVAPILDFDGCLVGRCLRFRSAVPYGDLCADDFVHAMAGIRTPSDLLERVFQRYSRSRPWMSRREMAELGVSATLLELAST